MLMAWPADHSKGAGRIVMNSATNQRPKFADWKGIKLAAPMDLNKPFLTLINWIYKPTKGSGEIELPSFVHSITPIGLASTHGSRGCRFVATFNHKTSIVGILFSALKDFTRWIGPVCLSNLSNWLMLVLIWWWSRFSEREIGPRP